jgi:hypothetical protein
MADVLVVIGMGLFCLIAVLATWRKGRGGK